MLRRRRFTPPPPSPPSYRRTRSTRSSLNRCVGTTTAAGIIATGITGVGIIAIGIGTIGITAIGAIIIAIGNRCYWREAGIFLPLLPRNKKPRRLAGFSVSRIFPQAEGDQIGRQRP